MFHLKDNDGDISEIEGHVEFMSGNLEISQMDIPVPVLEDRSSEETEEM